MLWTRSNAVGWLAALAVALLPTVASAQVQTGSILVRVSDEQGGVLPGANVTISSPVLVGRQMTGLSDASGAQRFPSLPPGIYSVRLELQGFQSVVRENIVVSVGQTTPVDLQLKVASLAETVTVTGESPIVDTTSANVSVTLNQQLLQATPGGRDIWSLVEYKVPGLATSRPDVGGAAGGLQGSFSARGTPNSQNAQFLNGINVGDPAAIGFTQFYYDYDAFEELQVSTGAHDLSVPSSGVFLNMVTKTGGNTLAGKASFFWQSDATQGQNVDDELRRFGFGDASGAIDFISDVNLQAGGPLVADAVRFFGSFRDWRVHVNVPGAEGDVLDETNITSGLGNLTWQVNQNNRVTGFISRQYYKKPNRFLSTTSLFTEESNSNEDDVTAIYQGLWNAVLSSRAFMDARVSFNKLDFPLYQKGTEQTLLDVSTNIRTRAAQQEQIFGRKRLQASANFQYYLDHFLGVRHELRFGIDHAHAPTTTAVHRIDDVNLTYRTQPALQSLTVELFNSPVDSRSNVDVTALYVQDSVTIGRATLIGGVRWERLEGYLPEQSSGPSRWFPSATRSFEAIHDIPNWTNVAPRGALTYDMFGNGKTALKVSAGRYFYTLGTGTPNQVNPNFNSSETYAWNDLNGDLVFQPNERGALQGRTGGLVTSLDPEMKRPHTDEFAVGIDHELIPNLRTSVIYTHRVERDNFGRENVAVPITAFTPITRVDPGLDGLVGTGDDGSITIYSQLPSTLGQDRFVYTNSELYNQDSDSFEVTATKRLSNRWQMVTGYTWTKSIQGLDNIDITTRVFNNPNELINAEGPVSLERRHTYKLTGNYQLPYDFEVSGNLLVQSGRPYGRRATFTGLPQGNVTVFVEPRDAFRLDWRRQLDLRLTRVFRFGARSLDAMIDVYNVTNANVVWEARDLTGRLNVREGGVPTGTLINQPQFLSPTGILGPRVIRFGAAYRF